MAVLNYNHPINIRIATDVTIHCDVVLDDNDAMAIFVMVMQLMLTFYCKYQALVELLVE
jgi:hypothetical protein